MVKKFQEEVRERARVLLGKAAGRAAQRVTKAMKTGRSSYLKELVGELDALLWVMSRSVGTSNWGYQESERVAARAVGDREREIQSYRRTCVICREGIKSGLAVGQDASNSTIIEIVRRHRRMTNALRKLHVRAADDEHNRLTKLCQRYSIPVLRR